MTPSAHAMAGDGGPFAMERNTPGEGYYAYAKDARDRLLERHHAEHRRRRGHRAHHGGGRGSGFSLGPWTSALAPGSADDGSGGSNYEAPAPSPLLPLGVLGGVGAALFFGLKFL